MIILKKARKRFMVLNDDLKIALNNDLRAKVRASFLILLQHGLEMSAWDSTLLPALREPGEAILRHALAMDILDEHTPEQKDKLHQTLSAMREDTIAAFRDCYTVKIYYQFLEHWFFYNTVRHTVNTWQTPDEISGELLLSNHLENFDSKDESANQEIMSQFMACIPLRMAREKYNGYVADALRYMYDNFADEPININPAALQNAFFPPAVVCQTLYCADMKRELDDIWQADMSQYGEADFTSVENRLHAVRDCLTKTVDCLATLFDSIGAVTLLLNHGADLLADNPALAEVLSDFREALESPDATDDKKAALARWLDAAINEALENLPEDFDEIYDLSDEIEQYPQEWQDMYDDWREAAVTFYENGLEYFWHPEDSADNTAGDNIDSLINGFISFTNTRTAELDAGRRRFVRQSFMGNLPYPYSYKDYNKYFMDTFNELDDKNKAVMAFYASYTDKTGRFDKYFGRSESDDNSNL